MLSLIAEVTECDFKQELERSKPRTWLKSVSSYANGIGGTDDFEISVGTNVGIKLTQSQQNIISVLLKSPQMTADVEVQLSFFD